MLAYTYKHGVYIYSDTQPTACLALQYKELTHLFTYFVLPDWPNNMLLDSNLSGIYNITYYVITYQIYTRCYDD